MKINYFSLPGYASITGWFEGLENISFNIVYISKIIQVTLTLKKGLIVDRWLLPIEQTCLMVDIRNLCRVAQNVTFKFLTKISGKNQSPTFPWYDTDFIEDDAPNNSSIVACVFIAAVMFLPSRCLATIRGYICRYIDYERDLWSASLRWLQVPRLHKDWFRYLQVNKRGGDLQTYNMVII
jgi:hypothetical protein